MGFFLNNNCTCNLFPNTLTGVYFNQNTWAGLPGLLALYSPLKSLSLFTTVKQYQWDIYRSTSTTLPSVPASITCSSINTTQSPGYNKKPSSHKAETESPPETIDFRLFLSSMSVVKGTDVSTSASLHLFTLDEDS